MLHARATLPPIPAAGARRQARSLISLIVILPREVVKFHQRRSGAATIPNRNT
jgi:hypothetical protein